MRFSPSSSLQCLAAAATDTTMSSSRFPPQGRSSWRRRLSDRPSSGAGGRHGGGEAFVSGDSHFRTVRDSNFEFQKGMRGDYRFRTGFPRQPFRPPPRPRPEDFRSWEKALSQPHPNCERFVVLSYNILADYLAKDHRHRLYFHIPPYILDWGWRKRRIMIELGLWSPDIMCLQEVDKFQDLEQELKPQGYHGTWKMRTGPPIDGCAIFWRTTRFRLLHEEHIEFDKLGLRNNVAQICVLESTRPSPTGSDSAASSTSCHDTVKANQVVVCNIHVLYNPNRGDIKIGQVRVLLDRAHAVSKTWNGAPVIVCGDLNCTPKSPLYNFISEQKLNLSGLAKNQVSGQFSASIYASQLNGPNVDNDLFREQSHAHNSVQLYTSVVNEAGNVQGSSSETHNPHMLQIDLEDASLTKNFSLPQRMMGVRDVSSKPYSDTWCIKENSTISEAGADEGHLENTLDGSIDVCKSSQCGLNDVSEKTLKSCNEQVGFSVSPPTLHTSNPVLANLQDDIVCDEVEKERLHFSKTALSYEDPEHLSSELYTAEKEADCAITHQSTKKMVDSASTRAEEPIQEADSSVRDLETTRGSEIMPMHGTQNFSSFHNNYKNETPGSDESNCSLNENPSSSGNQGDKYHCFGFGISPTASRSEETCKPGDAEDIPGKETICENRNDTSINSSSFEQTLHSFYTDMNQPESFSSLEGHIVGKLEEVNIDRLDATISDDFQLDNLTHDILDDSPLPIEPEASEVERKPYDPYLWTPTEVATASGNAECTIAVHNLKLKSTYAEVQDYAGTKDLSGEPQVTSYNRRFMGTVDYIWCSEGLQTVGVLDTIPKHILQRASGFPTRKWGSDHLALASQLAFTKSLLTEDTSHD